MDETLYNLDKLISITTQGETLASEFEWTKKKKRWWWSPIEEGFTYRYELFSDIWSLEELISREHFNKNNSYCGIKLLFKDKQLFYRPQVTLKFEGPTFFTKVFDTLEEAQEYTLQLQSMNPKTIWIKN